MGAARGCGEDEELHPHQTPGKREPAASRPEGSLHLLTTN